MGAVVREGDGLGARAIAGDSCASGGIREIAAARFAGASHVPRTVQVAQASLMPSSAPSVCSAGCPTIAPSATMRIAHGRRKNRVPRVAQPALVRLCRRVNISALG